MIKDPDEYYTVKIPALMPYLIGAGILFAIIGLVFQSKEIWGGIIAGFASILIWVFTYAHTEFKEKQQFQNFKIVVWTELRSLARLLFDEAKAWDRLTGNKPTGEETEFNQTERRIVSVFELAAIHANLNKLADLRPEVADGVIMTLGMLRTLVPAVSETYEVEDKLLRKLGDTASRLDKNVAAGQMNWETYRSVLRHDYAVANQIQYENRIKIIKLLVRIYGRANRTADLLDRSGTISAYQQSRLTEEQRIKQEKEEADMELMFAQYRNLGEWTKEKLDTGPIQTGH